ncbi:nucleotide exchange factor GrpE [Bdellovibrio sp. qaytius]|nr:nucleotide exchange factor GrpE [Bdellovibrio sp. qaytius]
MTDDKNVKQDDATAETNATVTPIGAEGTTQNKKSELETAQEDVQKWKNEYLYLRAEFDNFKKHTIKERSDLLKFGAERVARDILEVMDNFERALQTKVTPETLNTYKTGVEMTAKDLKEALTKHGIQEVPSENQPFNPQLHEAISSEPTTQVAEGHITKVFKKPYKLHDKVIRMGQVVVATAPKA